MENYVYHVAPERGPRIVAIGGGTGLSTLLRGLKKHTKNLTAIVTVTDDGGGSGTHIGIGRHNGQSQSLIQELNRYHVAQSKAHIT